MKKTGLLLFVLLNIAKANAQCWISMDAGESFSTAIKSDSSRWSWGASYHDEFTGDDFSKIPVTGPDGNDWQSVSSGKYHSLGLRTDGTLWTWGNNDYGQLGNGTSGTSSSHSWAIRVGPDADWQSVLAVDYHSLAIRKNGTLWAWGLNIKGQLGDGSTDEKHAPTQIGTDNHWKSLAGGQFFTVAVKTDGTLWAWGFNELYQLGDGTAIDRYVPTQVGTNTDWQSVTSGIAHTLAIKTDGSLWGWGDNFFGQLGDGTNGVDSYKSSPVRIGNETGWMNISAGSTFSAAIKDDGTLWTWGNNDVGQLGDESTGYRNMPAKIGTGTDWKTVSAGSFFCLALKTDSTLWAWGINNTWELGNGSTDHPPVYTPQLVYCGISPLPVKLISFTAQKQQQAVILNWQTGQEFNSKEYQVERSVNGSIFNSVGTVLSKNQPTGSYYLFKDLQPLSGKIYYRLKIINLDGSYSYSAIRMVELEALANQVSVYPNPVKNSFFIENDFKAGKIDVLITDVAGKRIRHFVLPNLRRNEVTLEDFKSGIYIVVISDGISKVSKKLKKE